MKRLLLLPFLLVGCGKKAEMCEPYTSIKLPEITRVDRCGDDGISGETTAKPEAFIAAFKAAGYELGRDVNEPKYAEEWFYAKKGAATYRVTAKFDKVEQREQPFFMITPDQPRKWMPETQFQALKAMPERREKLLAKWRATGDLFDGKAPKVCPPLDGLDAALAKAPNELLVNLDSFDLATDQKGRYQYRRGPELWLLGAPSESSYSSTENYLEHLAWLDANESRRIIPVMRVTEFEDPVVPTGSNVLGTFTPGAAAFDIAIVDLEQGKILCRAKGKAESSETIAATTTTTRRPDGSIEDINTTANAHYDLAENMRAAAFTQLARMSSVFPVRTAAKLPKKK